MPQNQNERSINQRNNPPAPNPTMLENASAEELGFARLSPLLPRIHADDQDKKTLCIFWVVLCAALILILILSKVAIPQLYDKQDDHISPTKNNLNCSFPNTPMISNGVLVCGSYYSSSTIGELALGWGPVNQFAQVYLQVIPKNLKTSLNFNTTINISIYQIKPIYNQTLKSTYFKVDELIDSANLTLQFSSDTADKLYASDGTTVLGYMQLVAILTRISDEHYFMSMKFDRTLSTNDVVGLYSQSWAINPNFTIYTIVLRDVFFGISILTMILYFLRFSKLPKEKRSVEQILVAILSILLIMFNDPFYPITVLKPNGVSAFFSILFIVNLVVMLFVFWIVTADRIHFEDGQLQSSQPSKKKIVIGVILWLELLICTMIYTIHQINVSPIVTSEFAKKFIPAQVIIIITLIIFVLYTSFRYAQICASSESKLWRSYIFVVFSSIFIVVIFIIACSNAFIPFNYEGPVIFLTYAFVNIYIYYLQYMYTVTRQEAQKFDKIQQNGGIEADHDVLTIGSIDIVDVDLTDGEKENKFAYSKQPNYELVEREEESQAPVAKNKSEFQSFDFQ